MVLSRWDRQERGRMKIPQTGIRRDLMELNGAIWLLQNKWTLNSSPCFRRVPEDCFRHIYHPGWPWTWERLRVKDELAEPRDTFCDHTLSRVLRPSKQNHQQINEENPESNILVLQDSLEPLVYPSVPCESPQCVLGRLWFSSEGTFIALMFQKTL